MSGCWAQNRVCWSEPSMRRTRVCITATLSNTASSRPSSASRSTSFPPNTWMTSCTETRPTAMTRPTAKCGTATFCPSSTRRARTASTSSASKFGKESGNSVGRKPICCTPANHTPASSSTPANHTPVSGSCYKKIRKDAIAGPTRCSGRPAACDVGSK